MSRYHKRKKSGGKVYDFWSSPEGVRLKVQHSNAVTSSFPAGCGTSIMAPEDLAAMRDLCDDILRALPQHGVVPWGDGWVDHKSRAYAMLPEQSTFKSSASLIEGGILMHDADAALSPDMQVRQDAIAKHEFTVKKACVAIDPPPSQLTAIEHMIQQVNEILQRPENLPHLQPYERDAVRFSNLVAIQPNFHNGDDYLPLHLDNPRHDGFGVVIVTVAVWGRAEIVLVDDGDPHPTSSTTSTTTTFSSSNTTITTNNLTTSNTTHTSQATTVNPTEEVRPESECVGSETESTVDLSIARCTSLHTPLSQALLASAAPVVCEGGIVFRGGEFIVHTEPAKPTTYESRSSTNITDTTKVTDGIATDTTSDTSVARINSLDHTCTDILRTGTNATSATVANITTTAMTDTGSKSWVFPLSPGQLYVLSGPARNKCAHGVVVIEDTVTNDTTTSSASTTASKRQRGRTSKGTGKHDRTTLPNLSPLTDLPSANTTTSATTLNANKSTSSTCTTTATQPNVYQGRVSLNFRFGLHTPDQAWEEIDRHWG